MPLEADLIFISLEDWDEVWRRNQFVCDYLAKRNPKVRILFVQPSFDLSHAVRTGEWSQLKKPGLEQVGPGRRIYCLRGWKLLPNTVTWMRKINEWLLRRAVQRAASQVRFRNHILWINDHSAVHMAGKMREAGVIYDVTDDWTAYLTESPIARRIREQDRELCGKADVVIVCSERLLELKSPLARHTELIPNGVDIAHYSSVCDTTLPLPEEARGWKHPVLGYTGTVHPDRVDVPLVQSMAARLPDATFVLVGPMMLPPNDVRRLQRFPNIILLGQRPYSRIPEYMRAFDICMVPHLVSPFTESLNPIKLWEYLAAGKPIVSTPVAGFRDFPSVVELFRNADELASILPDVLHEPAERVLERKAIAAQHSWDRRIRDVEHILRENCRLV